LIAGARGAAAGNLKGDLARRWGRDEPEIEIAIAIEIEIEGWGLFGEGGARAG
jgi:hypothetical protein